MTRTKRKAVPRPTPEAKREIDGRTVIALVQWREKIREEVNHGVAIASQVGLEELSSELNQILMILDEGWPKESETPFAELMETYERGLA